MTPVAGAAQQGSLQVTAAAQSVQGDPRRTAGQSPLEPDVGVSWLQPRTRFGTLQIELRGTRRDEAPHLGRALFSSRDLKHRGVSWTIEAGDTYFSPAIGEYRFANLAAPAVTFAGGAVGARTDKAAAGAIVGRTTISRNLFGTDPDTLDQDLALLRGSYKTGERLELFTRASRVRTGEQAGPYATIAASDQGGFAARWIVTPSVHLIGDGSVVSYRRRGAASRELDGSGVAGASFLLARGWVQVNAARFSPGEVPVLNQPLTDRQTVFAAGEIDAFARLRVFGGWEAFGSNVTSQTSTSNGTRAFGGVRTPVGDRSSVAVRLEKGDRRSRVVDVPLARLSDTAVLTAEWQVNLGAVSGVTRYSRRENVESRSLAGSYTVNDASGHLFLTLNSATQIFGNAAATRTTTREGGGTTFWQLGGGGQAQMFHRSLWLRAEGAMSRNADLLSTATVPQQSLNIGLNGEIFRNTILGLNLNADRLASPQTNDASWISRSSLRVTRTFHTASVRPATSISTSLARHGGTGSITGMVFSDWNANGRQDPGELVLENIPIRLSTLGSSTTSPTGAFAFTNVPIGMHQVGIDLSALPVDFDPPAIAQLQLQLGRGDMKRVAFGLVPLAAVSGSVVVDANGNGQADPGEPSIDGAVVVLDAGVRSERARNGRFRFEAVRSGDHTLAVLPESLPEGTAVSGPAEIPISLTREQPTADAVFLVAHQQRAELRKVFAPSAPRAAAETPTVTRRPPGPRKPASTPAPVTATAAAPLAAVARPQSEEASRTGHAFAIQIGAFNDSTRAAEALRALEAAGLPAYVVAPPASDPDAPYRVRVGRYETRAEAQSVASSLEKTRREKLWVVRER
jgi:cell division septation protein DedD